MNGAARTRVALRLGCALLLLAAAGGCGARQWMMNGQDLPNGLIIVLPGIDGMAPHNLVVCGALRGNGLQMAVELYDWTLPAGPLYNQCALGRNRRMADGLAARIVRYRRRYPGRPVFLVAHSGGTAIAAWAAEALPAGHYVEGIVMLASSLSPGYDLGPALQGVELGIVSFYSGLDVGLLGAGTSIVGTMDRRYTEAAGRVGFGGPSPWRGSRAGNRLFQIAWTPRMMRTGYTGGHFSCCAGGFIAKYVAGLLRSGLWDEGVMSALAEGRPALAFAERPRAVRGGPEGLSPAALAAAPP